MGHVRTCQRPSVHRGFCLRTITIWSADIQGLGLGWWAGGCSVRAGTNDGQRPVHPRALVVWEQVPRCAGVRPEAQHVPTAFFLGVSWSASSGSFLRSPFLDHICTEQLKAAGEMVLVCFLSINCHLSEARSTGRLHSHRPSTAPVPGTCLCPEPERL